MVQSEIDPLDRVFAALSDSTRREVLRVLGDGARSVGELAEPHAMSLTGFMKHLRVLEDAGLIARSKSGRVVQCELAAAPLQEAAVWLSRYESFWTTRLDALGRFLALDDKEPNPCPPPTSTDLPSTSPAITTRRSKRSGAPGPTRKR